MSALRRDPGRASAGWRCAPSVCASETDWSAPGGSHDSAVRVGSARLCLEGRGAWSVRRGSPGLTGRRLGQGYALPLLCTVLAFRHLVPFRPPECPRCPCPVRSPLRFARPRSLPPTVLVRVWSPSVLVGSRRSRCWSAGAHGQHRDGVPGGTGGQDFQRRITECYQPRAPSRPSHPLNPPAVPSNPTQSATSEMKGSRRGRRGDQFGHNGPTRNNDGGIRERLEFAVQKTNLFRELASKIRR